MSEKCSIINNSLLAQIRIKNMLAEGLISYIHTLEDTVSRDRWFIAQIRKQYPDVFEKILSERRIKFNGENNE